MFVPLVSEVKVSSDSRIFDPFIEERKAFLAKLQKERHFRHISREWIEGKTL